MVTILSVAEKPSVAKELAKIISGGENNYTRSQSHSPYNQLFEINRCQFKNQRASMIMTSVTGHLTEIEFETDYHRSWKNCRPIELFEAPIKKSVKKENDKIAKTLEEQAKKCKVLLLWLDCDTEGENIAFEVIDVCKKANPSIDIYRARFSALTHRDIMRTLNNPERPNKCLSDSVDARQEIDLRLGAAFTRFQSLRLQSKFQQLKNTMISYGPCQFPTLGFVVDRHVKIQEFKSESFWSIDCTCEFIDPNATANEETSNSRSNKMLTCNFNWSRTQVYDRFVCTLLYDLCLAESGLATVSKIDARPRTRQRPIPMNTITLQKLASTHLRMSSDMTMQVAESLYQRGIMSYPRTETDYFQEGFDLNVLIQEQVAHNVWGDYSNNLLSEGKFLWPRKGGHDDQAHPPIHPTKMVNSNELQNDNERKIYELVTRHFLACCSHDAKGDETVVTVSIGGPIHKESFVATGLMILERNYLDIYSYDKWNTVLVPNFTIGDQFQPKSLVMRSGKTYPPSPLSETELISQMDKNGIGTDATIAEHIKTIQKREYVFKDDNNGFIPTKLGLALVEGYNSMGYQLTKPYLRASLERDCHKVARGELRKEDVIAACLQQMRDCFLTVSREASKLDDAVAKHFDEMIEHIDDVSQYQTIQSNFSYCGLCNHLMDIKVEVATNANGVVGDDLRKFLYCQHCRKMFNLPKGELRPHEIRCMLCNYQVLYVLNRETNKEHTVCPNCFVNPPAPPIAEEGVSDFRCFSCACLECPLSGRLQGDDIAIAPCSSVMCSGTMKVKKSSKGGFMCACSLVGCNKVWWLPKRVVTSVIPKPDQACAKCLQKYGFSVLKLNILIDTRVAPPGIPPEVTACPVCDSIWDTLDHPLLPLPPNNTRNPPSIRNQSIQLTTNIVSNIVESRSNINIGDITVNDDSAQVPMCKCGVLSIIRTVQKESANKGKKFYCCPNPMNTPENCGFFEWINDSTLQAKSDPRANSNPATRHGRGQALRYSNDIIICSSCKESGHFARECPRKSIR